MYLRTLAIVPFLALTTMPSFGTTVSVDATADIYSAGHASLPSTLYPGTFAPFVAVSTGNQVLTFSSVTGIVGCNFALTNGPDGTCYPGVATTVTSYGGISGISVQDANMFLVGVFLSDAEPTGAGPAVLSYDYGTSGSLSLSDPSYTPALDQVFFIGDGLTGTGTGNEQQFYVPSDASRFYLGIADSFDSVPSYYADNVGSFDATFSFSSPAPEPATFLPVAAGLILAGLLRRRPARGTGRTSDGLPASWGARSSGAPFVPIPVSVEQSQ